MRNQRTLITLIAAFSTLVVVVIAFRMGQRRGAPSDAPMEVDELDQLADMAGVQLPNSTDSVKVFVEIQDGSVSFLMKCTFAVEDLLTTDHAAWLMPGSEVVQLGFEDQPSLAPEWYDVAPVKNKDLRFSKRMTFQNISSRIYGLLRADDGTALLYLDGMVQEGSLPKSLVKALTRYPIKKPNLVLGPTGQQAERAWNGDSLPAELVKQSTSDTGTIHASESFAEYGDWSTESSNLGEGFEALGRFESCLWQAGKRYVRKEGRTESSYMCIRGYFVLTEEVVDRLIKELKWRDASEIESQMEKPPHDISLLPPLIASDELVEKLDAEVPFGVNGIAILSPETRTLYLEVVETE